VEYANLNIKLSEMTQWGDEAENNSHRQPSLTDHLNY